MNINDYYPVGIRSLQCPDHAANLPPTVLTVSWMIGKRCNYDCSYCNSNSHDAISPFINFVSAKNAIYSLHNNAQLNNKKIRWIFTGGEPFIDPSFMKLAKIIKETDTFEQLNVSTNGSLPLAIYNDAARIFDTITISLHLERSENEINEIIEKIINLSFVKTLRLTVAIMPLPGKLQQVKTIIDVLSKYNVNISLPQIRPPAHVSTFISHGIGRKDNTLLPIDEQINIKRNTRHIEIQTLDKRCANFYSDEEHQYILDFNSRKEKWNNVGIWFSNAKYVETNTEEVIQKRLNKFENWTCFAGVDQIHIEFDGTIYKGTCLINGAVGNINNITIDNTIFSNSPVICNLKYCTCHSDLAVRKISRNQFINLIDKSKKINKTSNADTQRIDVG